MSEQPWYMKDYKELLKVKGRLIPVVQKELLIEYHEKSQHRDTDYLHPSDLAKKDWCGRASWYKIKKYEATPDKYSFSRLNVFEEGNNIHKKWQSWLHKAGILWGIWSCEECHTIWSAKSPTSCAQCSSSRISYREVPLRDDEHRIIGHADGEIEDDRGRALIEIKSVGLGTVRWDNPSLYRAYEDKELTLDGLWDNIKRPFASHLSQGTIYMHCRKVDTIIFIYEWKPTQQVKEFEVKFQPEIIAPVLENCKVVMDHLADNTVPDKPKWATNKSCGGCKYCPYKEVCWNGEKSTKK